MSGLFRLNLQDLLKGLVVTVLAVVLGTVLESLKTGDINWQNVGIVALSAGLGYILKQLSTDEQGKFLGKF